MLSVSSDSEFYIARARGIAPSDTSEGDALGQIAAALINELERSTDCAEQPMTALGRIERLVRVGASWRLSLLLTAR